LEVRGAGTGKGRVFSAPPPPEEEEEEVEFSSWEELPEELCPERLWCEASWPAAAAAAGLTSPDSRLLQKFFSYLYYLG
jgi:hypothetical protein